MLRINVGTAAGDTAVAVLRLEGQVTGPWVNELRRVCDETIGNGSDEVHPLVLDLTDVFFIDADGVALFQELAGRQVTVTNGSLFVTEQLKEVCDVSR
ncbi:MAG: STAS domain-containing protein [Acidobacteriota bacterium]